jgi:hypothetical protein
MQCLSSFLPRRNYIIENEAPFKHWNDVLGMKISEVILIKKKAWKFQIDTISMCSTRQLWNRRGRDRMVDGFTTTYVISAYHNRSCEFESVYDEVYSIKHYVFVLCALCCRFLWIVPSSCVPYVAGFSGLSLRYSQRLFIRNGPSLEWTTTYDITSNSNLVI